MRPLLPGGCTDLAPRHLYQLKLAGESSSSGLVRSPVIPRSRSERDLWHSMPFRSGTFLCPMDLGSYPWPLPMKDAPPKKLAVERASCLPRRFPAHIPYLQRVAVDGTACR